MKMLRLLLPVLVAVLPLRAADSIDDMVRKGNLALEKGDLVTAESLGKQVLRKAPNHIPANELMTRVLQAKVAAQKVAAKGTLAKVMIEEVRLEKVSLSEAIDWMRTKLQQKKVDVNVVLLDPQDAIRNKVIQNLQLKNVPASQVLSYLAEEAGGRLVFRETSVEVRPKE